MSEERSDKIVCPECGNDGTHRKIRYVESIQCYRTVLGVKDGLVQVESRYQTGEGYDEGRDPYFECHGAEVPGGWCGHRWPVPPAVAEAIDWVDDSAPLQVPPAPAQAPTAADAPAAADAPVEPEPEPSLESIVCPKCGVSVVSGDIYFIERIESDRHVIGVREGHLRVSSLYDTNADDGGGEDPHFECRKRLSETRWCDERWPVPAWVRARILWA